MQLNNRHIVVVGLARSGLAAARFLMGRGARVTITDHAPAARLGTFVAQARDLGIELELGGHTETSFKKADLIVVSPGVPHTIAPLAEARRRGVPVMGEVELASRFITRPIVAISGTNGKTTTTELLGRILVGAGLRTYVGGNIGAPLIDIAGRDGDLDIIVAEISSFQLDTIDQFKPHVAVLLNITPDHLDRYPSMDAYAASKGRLFANQTEDDYAICHGNDSMVQAQCTDARSCLLNFYAGPADNGQPGQGAIITPRQACIAIPGIAQGRIELSRTALKGPHNRENIAAASLAALTVGVGIETIQREIDQFQIMPHRLEPVQTINGIHFVNDSKATNVDAVIRALECFDRPVILIMGGRNKGYDFNLLFDHVHKRARKLIAIGEAGPEILQALKKAPADGAEAATDLDEAVRCAYAAAQPGDTVLLSPACASFDMFTSYGDRGEKFRQSVAGLVENSSDK